MKLGQVQFFLPNLIIILNKDHNRSSKYWLEALLMGINVLIVPANILLAPTNIFPPKADDGELTIQLPIYLLILTRNYLLLPKNYLLATSKLLSVPTMVQPKIGGPIIIKLLFIINL